MQEIDFSIIIATRNREAFLRRAIESVIAQKEVSYEIIIVDDASEDNTAELIQHFVKREKNIRYYRNQECLFAHISRRKGLEEAKGKYVIFLDDDDFYIESEFFKESKQILETYNQVNAVIASTIEYEDGSYGKIHDLQREGYLTNKECINHFNARTKPHSTLSAVFRKDALHKAGLYNSKMVNDMCIYLYGIMNGDAYFINKPVGAYREHGSNISKKRFTMDFVKDCLNDKIIIYKKICQKNILIDRKDWLYKQLSASIYYFLKSCGHDWCYAIEIFKWILLNGNGTQVFFLKRFIKKGIF